MMNAMDFCTIVYFASYRGGRVGPYKAVHKVERFTSARMIIHYRVWERNKLIAEARSVSDGKATTLNMHSDPVIAGKYSYEWIQKPSATVLTKLRLYAPVMTG